MYFVPEHAVDDLPRTERLCISRVRRIRKKLGDGSSLFEGERLTLLLQWERTLLETRAQLVAAGHEIIR